MKKLILLLTVILLAGCTSNKFDVPADANSKAVGKSKVTGTSMAPVIPNHSTVLLVKDWDSIKIGDIVSYRVAGDSHARIHRVCAEGIVKDGKVLTWRTRGDQNNFIDPEHVWPSTYIGTYIRTTRL